ncbi:MAG TPA: alkaline phosphatase D family protein [Flavipsychrobacter sp.]|nr:alkaline phosphatase D family protein [Flavipsychrobacter sp.]
MKYRHFILLFFTPLLTFAQPSGNFSFLTGSCAYIGPNDGDTSFYTYNGDSNIFYAMAKKDADFMLWLGDNWYLDKEDWGTEEGLRRKAHYARTVKTVQPLLQKGITEYAIWDDHDFGPNQSQQDYPLKNVSRQIFIETWNHNPSFGEDDEGIYTSFRREDVLFILLDNRWWRDFDRLWAYKFFKPNPNKRMFGQKQMKWLKQQLIEDTSAAFKVIVSGSQMLNPWSKGDCFFHFPVEYNELLDFIAKKKINGVLFVSGDVHFSEIIKLNRKDRYPLYDLTVSPLTSTISKPRGREKNNKYRVENSLIEKHNFARFTFTGEEKNRKMNVEFFDNHGKLIYNWSIASVDLRN